MKRFTLIISLILTISLMSCGSEGDVPDVMADLGGEPIENLTNTTSFNDSDMPEAVKEGYFDGSVRTGVDEQGQFYVAGRIGNADPENHIVTIGLDRENVIAQTVVFNHPKHGPIFILKTDIQNVGQEMLLTLLYGNEVHDRISITVIVKFSGENWEVGGPNGIPSPSRQ